MSNESEECVLEKAPAAAETNDPEPPRAHESRAEAAPDPAPPRKTDPEALSADAVSGSKGEAAPPPDMVRALALVAERRSEPGRPEPQPSFLRRFGPSAAVAVASLSLFGVAFLASPEGVGGAATPVQSQSERALEAQTAELATRIRTLSASLAGLRAGLEVVRANSDATGAGLAALRAGTERNRQPDEARALKRSIDALREGVEQAKSDQAAALGQLAQRLDRIEHDSTPKLAQLSDRLDRLERDQAAKLAALSDRLDQTERHPGVSNDVTGTINRAVAAPSAAANRSEGPSPPIVPGLYVRDVAGGAALIAGRGGLFEIARGDYIQGLGRVEAIERRGREWVVVTTHGIIEPERR